MKIHSHNTNCYLFRVTIMTCVEIIEKYLQQMNAESIEYWIRLALVNKMFTDHHQRVGLEIKLFTCWIIQKKINVYAYGVFTRGS